MDRRPDEIEEINRTEELVSAARKQRGGCGPWEVNTLGLTRPL
jgi:hypothetical protein